MVNKLTFLLLGCVMIIYGCSLRNKVKIATKAALDFCLLDEAIIGSENSSNEPLYIKIIEADSTLRLFTNSQIYRNPMSLEKVDFFQEKIKETNYDGVFIDSLSQIINTGQHPNILLLSKPVRVVADGNFVFKVAYLCGPECGQEYLLVVKVEGEVGAVAEKIIIGEY